MEIEETVDHTQPRRCLQRIPERISEVVERFFYKIGLKIAQRPQRWLIGCTAVILLCLSGLYFFRQEKNPVKLWVPANSDFVRDTEWLMARFEEGLRMETMILTADDVLEPHTLITLNQITKQVMSTQTSDQISWTDVCFKVPAISGIIHKNKRSIDDFEDDFFDLEPGAKMNQSTFEPAVHADPKLYCSIINDLPKACLVYSILDIWEYDNNLIRTQSKKDIIIQLNEAKLSPTLGHPMNYTNLLGGITRDKDGKIISAKAVKTLWVVHNNFSQVDMENFGNEAGTADWATDDVLKWELSLLDVLNRNAKVLRDRKNETHNVAIWYEAGRSFGDVSSKTIFQDMDKVVIGFVLMFIYVLTILSDCNWVEWRFCLTGTGLLCVGGAFIVAVGVCSILGIPYGPIHTSLPFLLLGLGVDDIFVMMASWKEIHTHKSNQKKPLEERIGLMLSHAGSAISITSLTDVVAFVIGASTILPSLQSFCIYAAIGVLVTFLLQITFFVGFFTLDAQRIEKKRNGVLPCIVHENFNKQIADPENAISTKFITNLYSGVVLTLPGKILILLVTLATASVSFMGLLQLEQWFDPMWFLPKDSYLSNFHAVRTLQYPNRGYDAIVLIGDVDYPAEFSKIITLSERMSNLSTIESIKPWPKHFAEFVLKHYDEDLRKNVIGDSKFHSYLSKFLFSRTGGMYQGNFRFDGKLRCGGRTPRILVATIDFTFKQFFGPHEWIPAMDESKEVASKTGINGFVTVWSKMFSMWVTDKLIAQEVFRNLLLALICVMGMTGVLIAEPQTCFWILCCVLLTLLNVCGFMFFWGLTIDLVSCIGLELAVGLSIDYAAHVAHAFLNAASNNNSQDRRIRTLMAMKHIGAAVAYGAGSTLLALSMMIFSESYVFPTFFKIFFLVIIFGIWHGLFLLPVILSTIGPRSLRSHKTQRTSEKSEEAENEATRPLRKEPEN